MIWVKRVLRSVGWGLGVVTSGIYRDDTGPPFFRVHVSGLRGTSPGQSVAFWGCRIRLGPCSLRVSGCRVSWLCLVTYLLCPEGAQLLNSLGVLVS